MYYKIGLYFVALTTVVAANNQDTVVVDAAIASDDECHTAGDASCSLNALQLKMVESSSSVVDSAAAPTTPMIAMHPLIVDEASDESTDKGQIKEFCEGCESVCGDYLTYGVIYECTKDKMCTVLKGVDENKRATWLCTCKDTKCDTYVDREPSAFALVDDVPEEFEPNLAQTSESSDLSQMAGLMAETSSYRRRRRYYFNSCAAAGAWMCGVYRRGNSCQCNDYCVHHNNCCSDREAVCHPHVNVVAPTVSGNAMTLYHTTSPRIARLILASNFRPGHSGWCGGAIYFLNKPILPKSKYAAGITKNGAIIQAQVNMGKICHMDSQCKGSGGHGVEGAKRMGCNSITFNPGDGDEFIIWDNHQITSKVQWAPAR